MFKPTFDDAVDSATVFFNLVEYQVLGVTRDAVGRREVFIHTPAREAGCPACGVISGRVHQRTQQRVRDVPFDGQVTVWWIKKRWRCSETLCARVTFTEHTAQVPPYARLTTRLKALIVDALSGEVRCADAVAREHGIGWPTVMRQLTAARAQQQATAAARPRLVYSLGIDEHRFRTVRWFKDEAGKWSRIEPWMTTFTNLATGQVIGVVEGRNCAAVKSWLRAQPRWWRHRVAVVAIDPSAAFRSAVRNWLPKARVSVDHFHLVKLGNDVRTQVRRRVAWDRRGRHDRRGRKTDFAWAHRLLLLRGYDTLSARGKTRLNEIFTHDDPTHEISAAWGVKEQLRRLLACTTLPAARAERARFNDYVTRATMTETSRLKRTIDTWWPEIETFTTTKVTNAKTEAANMTIKNIKRAGRGYRSHENYKCRTMLYHAAPMATSLPDQPRNITRKVENPL